MPNRATAGAPAADAAEAADPRSRPVGRAEVMAAVRESAMVLFAERGPDAVTVREVADRAGVNHALIHRHYGTKEELVRVVIAGAIERLAGVARGTANTGEDLRGVIAGTRREEPAIRLLAWAILVGYPIESVWPDYPAFHRVQSVLADEQALTDGEAREDPRITVATAAAMLLGWILFTPFLDRAAGLRDIPGFDDDQALFDAAQAIFDRAR